MSKNGTEARAFARGYVIARERPIVAGDYPPPGHTDHGSRPLLLAMGMGAAYAAAGVPFWEAVDLWQGRTPRQGTLRTMTPEFVARKNGGDAHLCTYHEIEDQKLDLVVTGDLVLSLYAGACEGRKALECEEGSWATLSTEAQDKVLALLDGAWISAATAPFDAAARALRHLAGRAEPEDK